MATASLNLNEDLKTRLSLLAVKRDRTAHWLMIDAITQYVEYEESIEQLRQEAEDSWENYKLTGLHLTLDEISGWLDSCADGEVKELPKCHV